MKKSVLSKYFCLSIVFNFLIGSHFIKASNNQLILNSEKIGGVFTARDEVLLLPPFEGKVLDISVAGARTITISTDPNIEIQTEYNPTTDYPTTNRTLNTSLPVGSIEGKIMVNEYGAANYATPIPVPLGIHGMQPNLSVSYNSQVGNSLLGWGWNLTGLSSITRTFKDVSHDKSFSTIKYNNDDALLLDGQRLNYSNEFQAYCTEIQNHSIIKKVGDYFEAKTKDGLIMRYGSASGKNFRNDTIFSWNVDYIEDPMGNYMKYTYDHDGICLYLKNIEYGNCLNNETNTKSFVNFYYEKRSDPIIINQFSKTYKYSKILYSIQTGTNNSYYRELRFKYAFDKYSKLVSVEEHNANQLLNSTNIKWSAMPTGLIQENPVNIDEPIFSGISIPFDSQSYKSFDFDGDGRTEVIGFTDPVFNGSHNAIVYDPLIDEFGKVNQFNLQMQFPLPSYINETIWNGALNGDITGDGKNDLVIPDYISNGKKVRFTYFTSSWGSSSIESPLNCGSSLPNCGVSDLNNDGYSDLIYLEKQGIDLSSVDLDSLNINDSGPLHKYFGRYYDSKTSTWHWYKVYLNSDPVSIILNDFNNDGFKDLLVITKRGFFLFWTKSVTTYGGITFSCFSWDEMRTDFGDVVMGSNINAIGDFNNDGLDDIILGNSSCTSWALCTNNGKEQFPFRVVNELIPAQYRNLPGMFCPTVQHDNEFNFKVLDFDFDGKDDLITNFGNYTASSTVSGQNVQDVFYTRWYRSTGDAFELVKEKASQNEPYTRGRFFITGDFNGDNSVELLNKGIDCCNSSNVSTGWHLYCQSEVSVNMNKVVEISNGMNNLIKIDYSSLAINSINKTYEKSDHYDVFPLSRGLYSLNVVKSLQVGQVGLFKDTKYMYKGAKINLEGLGFIGFEKTIARNQVENRLVVTDYSYLHNINYNAIWGSTDANGVYSEIQAPQSKLFYHLMPEVISTYTFDSTQLLSKSILTNDYTIFNNLEMFPKSNVYSVFPHISLKKEYDYLQNKLLETQNTIVGEDGNIYAQTVSISDVNGTLLQTKSQTNEFEKKCNAIWPNRLKKSLETNQRVSKTSKSYLTEYSYYDNGLTKTKTDFSGSTDPSLSTYGYDAFGNLTSKSTTNKSYPTYSSAVYDLSGRFKRYSTNTMGQQDSTEYDVWGNIKSYSDILGNRSSFEYDIWGNLTMETTPEGIIKKFSRSWLNDGEFLFLESESSEGNPTFTKKYDGFGRVKQIEKESFGGAILQNYNYNLRNQLESETKPHFVGEDKGSKVYTYHSITGDLLTMNDGDTWITLTPDYPNRKITIEKAGETTIEIKDALGLVISRNENGLGAITYDYNSDGQLSTTVCNGRTTTLEYDEFGNLWKYTDPTIGQQINYYNSYGQLKLKTESQRGITTENIYDPYGRIETTFITENSDEMSGSITYDYYETGFGKNQLGAVSFTNYNDYIPATDVDETFTYDSRHRLSSKTQNIDGKSFKTQWVYNKYNQLISTTNPGGFTKGYEYDVIGTLKRIYRTDTGSDIWSLLSINSNENAKKWINCSLTTTNLLNNNGYPDSRITTGEIQSRSYTFNVQTGNLDNETNLTNNQTLLRSYIYDHQRLQQAKKFVNTVEQSSIDYVINNDGNITYKADVGTYAYKTLNPFAVDSILPSTTSILESTTENQDAWYYPFHRIGTLLQGTSTSGSKIDFCYGSDNDRWRMRQYSNGGSTLTKTRYYSDSYEKDIPASGNSVERDFIYGPEGHIIAFAEKTGSAGWVVKGVYTDHLGSVIAVSDQNGNILGKYDYDAWGRRSLLSGNFTIDRGYTGHEHLDAFGLINMNARLYDPAYGRFLSADSYIQDLGNSQSFNRYSYCQNNPLKYTDPSGNSWKDFQEWFDRVPGTWLANHGITSFSLGWSSTGGIGVGVGVLNNQEIVAGYNYESRRFGWGKQTSDMYYPSADRELMQNVSNSVDKAFTPQDYSQVETIDNNWQATMHYVFGDGSPVRIGPKTTAFLLNSQEFHKAHQGIVLGQSYSNNMFKVNMTFKALRSFHVGQTSVSYSINRDRNTVTYKIYDKDGFWDPDFIDEKILGPFFHSERPDGPGPNLERLGGTPYHYIPSIKTLPLCYPLRVY